VPSRPAAERYIDMREISTPVSALAAHEHSRERVRYPVRWFSMGVPLIAALLVSCGLSDCGCPTQFCPQNMVPDLWVTVLDARTGLATACGATVWITEHVYIDTLECIELPAGARRHRRTAAAPGGVPAAAHACVGPHLWQCRSHEGD
jgi:hypothetical protein